MSNIITLPSGKTATIREAKGKDVRLAQRLSQDDTSLFLNAYMSLCVEIDGQPLVVEDFDELPAKDYTAIMTKFQEVNF